MAKKKHPKIYFSSDWHMNHYSEWIDNNGEKCSRGIITFERWNFETIQEHDNFIADMVREWSEKWTPGSTLYYLGDFGDIAYLWLFDILRDAGHKVIFLYGNHDKDDDYDAIAAHVDEVYKYPVYLSNKLVVSHEPVGVWKDTVNVSGHLHGAILDSPNYINASLHVANYKPVSMKEVNSHFSKLPKYNRRFLYEPFANMLKFTQAKEDVIMDKDGRVDLSASRLLQKLNAEKRVVNNEPYRPYTGGLS